MARPRKPTAVLEASGAFKHDPQRREARGEEPDVSGEVKKPPGMSLEAERHWPEVYQILNEAGVIGKMDGFALALWCETYHEWREARDNYRRQPVVFKGRGKTRQPIPSPWHTIASVAEGRLLKLITEFGMTPASRSKVSGKKKQEKQNRFASIFAGSRPKSNGTEEKH